MHKKKWIKITVLICCCVFFVGTYLLFQVLVIGSAYKAKLLCSNVFYSDRDADVVINNDLTGPERFIPAVIDYDSRMVTSGISGLVQKQALYLNDLGCVLLNDTDEHSFRKKASAWLAAIDPVYPAPVLSEARQEENQLFQYDAKLLGTTIQQAFSEPDPDQMLQTRAILVQHQGTLIVEEYADGYDQSMPLLGWSMSKSVLNALLGILVYQGRLALNQPAPVPQWQEAGDPRSRITIDQLMRMSSGLKFYEPSGSIFSDVSTMLFKQADSAAYAANKSLQYEPDSHWAYSSGTSNILSALVRALSGGTVADTINFMRRNLLHPLGIYQATIEPDSRGNLVASSFMYATPWEWLRFGQLYLQDGVWAGQRILPEGWVAYSSQYTPTASSGEYGAHFWTNGDASFKAEDRPFPELPSDLFYAAGYKGQRLIVIPSEQLVILRMGWGDGFQKPEMVNLVKGIINSVHESKQIW